MISGICWRNTAILSIVTGWEWAGWVTAATWQAWCSVRRRKTIQPCSSVEWPCAPWWIGDITVSNKIHFWPKPFFHHVKILTLVLLYCRVCLRRALHGPATAWGQLSGVPRRKPLQTGETHQGRFIFIHLLGTSNRSSFWVPTIYTTFNCSTYVLIAISPFQGKRLYLVHGMADANVHLQNSMVFANHLVAYNVPFQQQVRTANTIQNVATVMFRISRYSSTRMRDTSWMGRNGICLLQSWRFWTSVLPRKGQQLPNESELLQSRYIYIIRLRPHPHSKKHIRKIQSGEHSVGEVQIEDNTWN